jgi:hypothetical protein
MIEGLEGRQLLSATLVNGVLTVTGTAAADRIELERKSSDRLRLRENGRDRTFSYAASRASSSTAWPAATESSSNTTAPRP